MPRNQGRGRYKKRFNVNIYLSHVHTPHICTHHSGAEERGEKREERRHTDMQTERREREKESENREAVALCLSLAGNTAW